MGKPSHLAWRSGAVTELAARWASVMQTATGRRWGQVSDKGAPSSDRNLFSAFSFLPVTQLSYVAEDENGKIVGYVLAKM